ncbi:formate dehydrogenase subunit gamma [Methylobacterium phyllosphaerae]
MTIHSDIRDGDPRPLHPAKSEAPEVLYVPRYTGVQRVNHWITAILFTLLTLSGLAMFTPYLFSLTGLFGGGQATRAIHPWFGVALAVSFFFLFVRFWRLNIPNRDDVEWTKHIGDVVTNREDRLPELGKYNAGQKGVFWGQTALIGVMFVTGLVIWNTYFGGLTSIETQRWALLAHSLAAVIAIAIIVVHVYAGIWVRGTGRAMVRGTVTGGWAYRHHRKWFRQIVGGKARHGSVDKRGS